MRCERESVVVVSPVGFPVQTNRVGRETMGRCIGLDVHRDFAQVAIWENGRVRDAGRVATPERLREFATTLRRSDRVALEATMNTAAIAGLLAERAGEVVVSNPFKTRVIAEAKIKTDKVDALGGRRAFGR
jgi:transposase